MTNLFTRVFLPIFAAPFILGPLWLFLLGPCLRRRRRHHGYIDATELTTLAVNNARISRIAPADVPPPSITRPNLDPPTNAALLRRGDRLAHEQQNPFADPPSRRSRFSFRSFTGIASSANFSTPSRKSRFSTPAQDIESLLPSRSVTRSESAQSIISTPDLAYCPVRSAGRAPPLGPQLERFPIPKSASSNHVHPNKLFQDLSRGTSQQSTPTKASSAARPEPERVSPPMHCHLPFNSTGSDSFSISPLSSKGEANTTPTLPTLPALKSTVSEADMPVHHEVIAPKITTTGARTPVSAIRDMFDRKASAEDINIPQSNTFSSSAPPTASTVSGKFPSDSPPSSPPRAFESPTIRSRNKPTPLNLAPLSDSSKQKLRASSLYSRDTQGVPLGRSPMSATSAEGVREWVLSPHNLSELDLNTSTASTPIANAPTADSSRPLGKAPGGAEWI